MFVRATLMTLALLLAVDPQQQPPSNLDLIDAAIRVLNELRAKFLPTTPAPVVVPQGGNLGAAIAAATPGTVLELEPGPLAFTGNFRSRPGLTFRTRGLVLPARTAEADDCARMARVRSTNNAPAMQVPPGVHDVVLENLDWDGPANDVILVGAADNTQTTLDQVPRRVTVRQNCIAGVGAKNGVAIHSAETRVIFNFIRDVARFGTESHGIVGFNGPGPFVVTDNRVLGSSIGIFFGGADPAIPGVIPSDIVVARNVLQKHPDWQTRNYAPKNAFECKACRRVDIDQNLVDYMPAGGQPGWAIVFTPSQDRGTPWAIIEDVTFRRNTLRRIGGVFNILGHGQNQTTAGRATLVSRNIAIVDNWVDGCDAALGGHGALAQFGNGPINVAFEHNTIECNGSAFLRKSDTTPLPGFRYVGNLQSITGQYGIFTPTGSMASAAQTAIVLAQFPGGVFTGNGMIGAPAPYRAAVTPNFYAATSAGLIEAGYGVGAAAAYGRRR